MLIGIGMYIGIGIKVSISIMGIISKLRLRTPAHARRLALA